MHRTRQSLKSWSRLPPICVKIFQFWILLSEHSVSTLVFQVLLYVFMTYNIIYCVMLGQSAALQVDLMQAFYSVTRKYICSWLKPRFKGGCNYLFIYLPDAVVIFCICSQIWCISSLLWRWRQSESLFRF